MSFYYQVAVNYPKKPSVLTYQSNEEFQIGDLVTVPLGRRSTQGTVLRVSTPEEKDAIETIKIKHIESAIENAFQLTPKELELYKWMSQYYHYPMGKLIFDCLPKVLKRPRKANLIQGQFQELPFKLNADQAEAFEKVSSVLDDGFSGHYLHGVTGAGKSAIYLKLMQKTIESGKSVQFLLPEINLTPQFTKMFETYLGCEILTYHSGVTPSDKYNIWKTLNESDKPVLVMGVRSSIFLPIKDLGLVIIDEEHDQSFKQTDRCPYNGRDVAIKKAQIHNCPYVLGSATPSLENFHIFGQQEHQRSYYPLKSRVGEGSFPKLELIDLTEVDYEANPSWPLLEHTIDVIEESLNKNEQVLVFINKLGFSNYIQCRNCGHQFYNQKCGCFNNLRYFKAKNVLSCAHCEFKMPVPKQCPECGSLSLLNKGFGTERVEQILNGAFPGKRIERFDRDEIKNTKDLNDKLQRFHNHEIDIFVGTQMLAKGHNFQKVNLVVILGIDSMLNYADFRSNEKTYQLIEQVAGRAGRYSADSKVLIQTMNPHHSLFKLIQAHSFDGFYKDEIPLRQLCDCPPFSKITMLYFSSRFRDKLITHINSVAQSLNGVISNHLKDVRLLGPTPMGIEKKANQFTWAIMLKSRNINALHQLVHTFELNYQSVSNISYKIDVDPIHII